MAETSRIDGPNAGLDELRLESWNTIAWMR
jgi:hypothetical protein